MLAFIRNRRLFLLGLLLLLMYPLLRAEMPPVITFDQGQITVLRDKSKQFILEQLRAAHAAGQFKPLVANLGLGYSHDAVWLHLSIAQEHPAARWLEVMPPYLDDFRLFYIRPDGQIEERRSGMMMASMMGAIAFQKHLGAVHSCAHVLGAVCDLHHGLANALMIDTVLAWNLSAVPSKFDELAHVCRVAGGGAAFEPWLKALKASVGITGGLAAHGVTPAHLPRLVAIATADICHQTNPRPCTAADFGALFKAAM